MSLRLAFTFASVLMIAAPVLAADDDVTPPQLTDFAYGMKFDAEGTAAAFRANVPEEVYRGVTRADLADVAVFNGRGEVVPHVLEAAPVPTPASATQVPLAVFPLRGNERAVMEALRVTIQAEGGKFDLALPEQGSGTSPTINGYILDGRATESALAALQIGWPEDASEFAGKLRIEGSSDLGNWRTIVDGAPIANLRAGESKLVERRVVLPHSREKFWRLSWVGTQAPFEITSVTAELAGERAEVARPSLVLEGKPVPGKPGEFEFDAGGAFPVDRVNVVLPELNSVIEVSLLSRPATSKTWTPVARHGFYRLQGADGELVNGDVMVYPSANRFWLARVDARGNGLGSSVPKLRIAYPPHRITFLARGEGPFTLAFGNGAMNAAAGRIASIPKGAAIRDTGFSQREVLGGEARLASASGQAPTKSMVLWGVLGLGVALLAYMAWRLSREMRSPQSPGG